MLSGNKFDNVCLDPVEMLAAQKTATVNDDAFKTRGRLFYAKERFKYKLLSRLNLYTALVFTGIE
ncbi:MAG: hypothetical protein V1794_12060 [Candidatus Glassbacteria bacterium]